MIVKSVKTRLVHAPRVLESERFLVVDQEGAEKELHEQLALDVFWHLVKDFQVLLLLNCYCPIVFPLVFKELSYFGLKFEIDSLFSIEMS